MRHFTNEKSPVGVFFLGEKGTDLFNIFNTDQRQT